MIKLTAILTAILLISLTVFSSEEVAVGNVEAASAKAEAKVVTVAKSEDQIPLNIDQVKKASDETSASTRLMMTGVIVSVLLSTAYYFVRKYKFSNSINKSNMQIKVLSQHYLGPKKSLAIVRVAGESILIGVTDSNISMIKSLSLIDDEIPSEAPQSFKEAMLTEKVKSAMPTTAAGATARPQSSQVNTMGTMATDELEEEFSFSGLKDTVSKKLKSMRSI